MEMNEIEEELDQALDTEFGDRDIDWFLLPDVINTTTTTNAA